MSAFSNQTTVILAAISGILALLLSLYNLFVLTKFNKLKKTFFAGSRGEDLETVINSLANELENLRKENLFLEREMTLLKNKFTFSVQKIGIVRFNPFGDAGGNFSFSLALLDGHDTGVVITSMHGRQQNRIYTKKIQGGAGETELTQEEQQAILLANQKTKVHKEN